MSLRSRSRCRLAGIALGWLALGAASATDLPEAQPEQVGIDSRPLVSLSRAIRERGLDVRSLLVVRRGKLVFERYSAGVTRDHNHAIYSVTKSVSSTLVGILVEQGRLAGAEVPIIDVLPAVKGVSEERREARRAMRVEDVLRMASGLEWVEDPVNTPLYRAPDRLAVALRLAPAHPPGKVFNYSNADAEMIGATIHHLSGSDGLRFAREYLFEPLGMKNYDWWYPDRKGRYPGGWAMRLRAMDMAKLGLLWLEGGQWNGRRILGEAWIRKATRAGAVPYYGYFWWLNTLGLEPPLRAYSANGWKGQYVIVVPDLELVVTMTSVLASGDDRTTIARFLREFIVPAVRRGKKPLPSDPERVTALRDELALSARTSGVPGQPLGEQDEPKR